MLGLALGHGLPYRAAVGPDPAVILLMRMEGANNGTVFTDSSMYARQVINSLNHTKTTTAVVLDGTSSAVFDGVSALNVGLGTLTNSDLTGDFTIEGFAQWNGNSASNCAVYSIKSITATLADEIEIYRRPASAQALVFWNNGNKIIGPTPVPNNQKVHWCAERVGTTITLTLDGVSQGTFTSAATFKTGGGANDFVGSYGAAGDVNIGYIDGVRVTRRARYKTYPFTPPTSI